MGYQQGLGLGKNQQGSIAPIQVGGQLGKRGLGLELPNLQSTKETWDFSKDVCD